MRIVGKKANSKLVYVRGAKGNKIKESRIKMVNKND